MAGSHIVFSGENYTATLDADTGKLRSYCSFGVEMISEYAADQPLMELRAFDHANGRFLCFTEQGADCLVEAKDHCCIVTVHNFPEFPSLRVVVNIDAEPEQLLYHTVIHNSTPYYIENFACPIVQLPGNLTKDGGDMEIFWSRFEGVLIQHKQHCLPHYVFSLDKDQPLQIARYYYPGSVTMQHMAAIRPHGSLYFASHDIAGIPKAIAPTRGTLDIRLDLRPYPCVAPGETWTQPFPIVLRPYLGGWEEACEIYRSFLKEVSFPLPPKLFENKQIPKWVKESPVVILYPPRSIRGTGYMGPNEYFPYSNGLKYLDELRECLQSPVMAYLTYWEGTAPWAPPFAWPPYGGQDLFQSFVDQMHRRGNHVALYCSGIHWTDKHHLIPEYDMTAYRIEHGYTESMCRLPDGRLSPGLCTTIRSGFTFCSSQPEPAQILRDQLAGMLSAKVDYIQLFDQHMGGQCFPCYAANHNHPACFGPWSTHAMNQLYSMLDRQIEASLGPGGSAIGAEGIAADIFSTQMPISESRGHMNLAIGRPVPAASYVLHEYTANFMDNMCSFRGAIDRYKNEDTLLYSLAYAFTAGDALTLVLKSGGEIHYDWGQSWLEPGPRQEPVKKFVRRLNALRRGVLKDFLIGGQMMPTLPFCQPGSYTMTRLDDTTLTVGEVLSSSWKNRNGERIQLFTNFRETDIEIIPSAQFHSILTEFGILPHTDDTLVVPAFSALAIRLL